MSLEESVYRILDTLSSETFQKAFLTIASGALAAACARSKEIQKTINELSYETLDEKTLDRGVYPFMAGFGVMIASYSTNSLMYGVASLVPFAACSLWPGAKNKPAEDHSTRDEELKKLKGNNKY